MVIVMAQYYKYGKHSMAHTFINYKFQIFNVTWIKFFYFASQVVLSTGRF